MVGQAARSGSVKIRLVHGVAHWLLVLQNLDEMDLDEIILSGFGFSFRVWGEAGWGSVKIRLANVPHWLGFSPK